MVELDDTTKEIIDNMSGKELKKLVETESERLDRMYLERKTNDLLTFLCANILFCICFYTIVQSGNLILQIMVMLDIISTR